jgi:hypothetical protein
MQPAVVLFANAAAGVVLVVIAGASRLIRFPLRRAVALAVMPLLIATLLSVYVFGEDSYRGTGVSRWNAYRSPGGALGPMFVLSVALLVLCTAALAYACLGGKERLFGIAALGGGLTSLILVTATIIGFTAN